MIHAFGSAQHYLDHLSVVWAELGIYRGQLWSGCKTNHPVTGVVSIIPREFIPWTKQFNPAQWWLVASFQDVSSLYSAGFRNIIMMEHGMGQSYMGVSDPSYIGPGRNQYVKAYWMPNPRAQKLQQYFTQKPVELLPALRIQKLRKIRIEERQKQEKPVVVVSFHGHSNQCPEMRSTWNEWLNNGSLAALKSLETIEVVGHAHPTARRELFEMWNKLEMPTIESFDDVIRYADAYVVDNSSTLFEAAGCGLPVALLNGGIYRPAVMHGLRFWEYASIGTEVWARNPQAAQVLPKVLERIVHNDPSEERRTQIVSELFDFPVEFTVEQLAEKLCKKSTPTPTALSTKQAESTEETMPVYIYARSLKDQSLPYEGEVKTGQVFRPGWKHKQQNGNAVPVVQNHHKPAARLALLVSSGLATPVESEESIVKPKPEEIVAPQPEEAPVESEKPMKRSKTPRGKNTRRNSHT